MNARCLYYQSKVEVSSKNTAKMSVCEKYRKVQTKAAIGRTGSLDLVTVRLLTTTYCSSNGYKEEGSIGRCSHKQPGRVEQSQEYSRLKTKPSDPPARGFRRVRSISGFE